MKATPENTKQGLTVQATLVAEQQNNAMKQLSESSLAQNEEIKKISSWAAILFAPTLIGTIYGMNFDNLPELGWVPGIPLRDCLMVLMGIGLYWMFKRRKWL